MKFKGGAWKPVVAELREHQCLRIGSKPISKIAQDLERLFKYYVQWFGFEKMEFQRMRQKFVDLRRRSLKQYHKDQDTIKELQGYVKTLEANMSNSVLRRLQVQLDEEIKGD